MRADVAIIGYGNVGRRFASLLDERRHTLDAEYGLSVRIVATATRRDGPPALDLIRQLERSGAQLRVVVETTTLNIADGEPAISHVKAAIAAGCHVVTANKGPVAFAYEELQAAADAAGVSFLFEGAVMDGIPIFNLVRETMPAVEIAGFRGIVNTTATSSSARLEDGEPFAPALADAGRGHRGGGSVARHRGWDAAAKTAALANVLMHAGITPHDVDRRGIGEKTAAEARAAKAAGRRLRLVAEARRLEGNVVDASVKPVALGADDLLAGIRGTANALVLRTDLLGDVAICQLAADLTQTAYALLGDLITVRRRQARRAAPLRRSLTARAPMNVTGTVRNPRPISSE
jgi:homoserine dehydrogenase